MKLPCTTGPVVTPILPPQSTCQPATNQVGRCGTVELFTINFYSILNFFSFSIFIQIFSSSTSANLICYQLIFLAELLFPCYIYLYHFYVKYRIYDAEKSLFLIFLFNSTIPRCQTWRATKTWLSSVMILLHWAPWY